MILVTGATGLVGAHLCLALLKNEHRVVALFRREKKKEALQDFFIQHNAEKLYKKIIWRKADLTNLPALTQAFEGITHVYHCAAYISMAYHKGAQMYRANQEGTAYITYLCAEKKIEKLVYVSSIAALGSDTPEGPINEDTPWNGTNEKTPYAYSKYGAELEVWRCAQEGVPVAIVNPGVILGLGMPNNPLDQLLNLLEKKLFFYPTGVTGFVCVEDVVEVMQRLMNSSIINERFILVAENWSYQKMLHFIGQHTLRTAPKRPLPNGLLWCAWVIETVLSVLGLRRKFLSKALVTTLMDKRTIDGNKVTQRLSWSYTPIDNYLKQKLG